MNEIEDECRFIRQCPVYETIWKLFTYFHYRKQYITYYAYIVAYLLIILERSVCCI